MQKCEPSQYSNGDMIEETGETIVWGPPEREVGAAVDHLYLMPEGCSVFILLDLGAGSHLGNTFSLDAADGLLGVC